MEYKISQELLSRLVELTTQAAAGQYESAQEIFGYTKDGEQPQPIRDLAEALGMMFVQAEGREFRLQQLQLPEELLQRLMVLTKEVAGGRYENADGVFELTQGGKYPERITELAEAFGMMIVQVEGREFRLAQLIDELKRKNQELAAALKRVELLETIESHLAKFVPQSVKKLIDTAPESPDLEKRERDVSVLFLDIAGYTRMSETVKGEDMNWLVEQYFSAFLDDIYQNQGDINETAGDGLMILFQGGEGQNHAQDAVRCALAVRQKVQTVNKSLAGRFQPVTVNLGINTGTCLVGSSRFEGIAGTRWTFTASGSVTNVAARIGAHAKKGQVLIGSETACRLDDSCRLNDLGPQRFKNVSEPVEVFEVQDASQDSD